MSIKNALILFYRKYPLVRLGTIILAVVIAIGVISFFSTHAKHPPVITSITPPVGAPGDLMTITGSDFGALRSPESYVEVGGSKITSSGYLSWSNKEIRIILPTNVQDGLVIVGTKNGESKPGFFANEAGIPIAVPVDTKTTQPVITDLTPSTNSYGALITLSGSNFGTVRGNSGVYFTANRDDSESKMTDTFNLAFVQASESNYDYEYWSDTEIHVRIPDGAASGSIYVKTDKGESNRVQLQVASSAGTRSYTERKTYVLQLSCDVENIDPKIPVSITLRVPRPPVTAQQPLADLSECTPDPLIENYRNMIIHQLEFDKNSVRKTRVSQNFLISAYTLTTSITERNIKPFSEKSRTIYSVATQNDSLIQSKNTEVTTLAADIIKREKNPYRQARLLYDWLLDSCRLTDSPVKKRVSPIELLAKKQGDAYDFAICYTTLARACGIPALPVSGILVDSDLKTANHWWCEIYLENFGWIPVDPALGAGLSYKAFRPVSDVRTFYFGNLDSQHIAFSRGWNEVKPSFVNSKTVYRERTYALQSIWEESSGESVNYSSLWNNPIVLGVY
ncbi:MAG: IPT/TIG domain-containing protein [Treponema sp.]|nr:IPT/TIG domain-containing protein [Treponema sp.]